MGHRSPVRRPRGPRPLSVARKTLLGKAVSAVRDALRASEAWLVHPASSQQFCTPTTPDEIHEISPAPPRPLAVARACPGPPLEVLTCFSDAPADHSPRDFGYRTHCRPLPRTVRTRPLPYRGALDDVSYTTKIAIHSGAGVLAPFGCVALLDTGSSQTFSRGDVWDYMLSVGAASMACEQKCAPRS